MRLTSEPPPAARTSPKHSLRLRRRKKTSATAVVSACGCQRLPKTETHSISPAHHEASNDCTARAALKSHAKYAYACASTASTAKAASPAEKTTSARSSLRDSRLRFA